MLGVAVISQAVTVWMTWPLWQVRESGMPNLPVFSVPDLDFGILMIASLLMVVIHPRSGVWIHLAVLFIATLFDQVRAQPQILAGWILILATITPNGTKLGRWFLVSLWLWAGLHKLLSPDWHAHESWNLIERAGLPPENLHLIFVYVVAFTELILGLTAWFRPRWAIALCPLVHIGIAVFLSPLFCSWNYSVIPWNLATGLVGGWIMWRSMQEPKSAAWEKTVLAALLVLPWTFYLGVMDHGYSHVLYSGYLPRGCITRTDGSHFEIVGWDEIAVPFPKERRLLKAYFVATANTGQKLHIHDPRPMLNDQYFEIKADGLAEISREEFYQASEQSPAGIGVDSRRSIFRLSQAGTRLLAREAGGPIYAIEINPERFKPQLLEYLAGLPNIEQKQLSGTDVQDDDLDHIVDLPRLQGIGLSNTKVTGLGLRKLKGNPSIKLIEADHLVQEPE